MTLTTVDSLLSSGITHAPIVDSSGEMGTMMGIVWENTISLEAQTGRLVVRGWNQERGYMIGGDPTAFESPDSVALSETSVTCNAFTSNDRAVWHGSLLMIVGRTDAVVKVRGHRVDLSGMEALLLECEQLVEGVVLVHEDAIWALVVTADVDAVRVFVGRTFEASIRPTVVRIEAVPKTLTGKQDRNALKSSMAQLLAVRHTSSSTVVAAPRPDGPGSLVDRASAESHLDAVLEAVHIALGFRLQRGENLFENGCTSIKAMRLAASLKIPIASIFAHPTPEGIATLVATRKELVSVGGTPVAAAHHVEHVSLAPAAVQSTVSKLAASSFTSFASSDAISIAGMAVHLPGGIDSLGKLWKQLYAATDLTEELPTAYGDAYITRKGVVNLAGLPSAATLSVLQMPAEVARRMGPEQRVALELAVAALRDAGIDPADAGGHRIGVFVSSSSLYHPTRDLDEMRTEQPDAYFAEEIAHDKDYVASTISYYLGLTGPAEVIQTACSSSLVAVVRAVHAIRLGQCDVAICGGVSLSPNKPLRKVEGMIWSPDGVCRPFADDASGTVPADGGALIVITAGACARQCYAKIKGVAVNNDGKRKSAFSQPSHLGQVEVIRTALIDGGIEPAQVDYIECHGTGTRVGDPIELHALAAVHADRPVSQRPLLVGSIKGNLGHMNTAAGIGSLVKAALCTYHGEVPPNPYSERPNELVPWSDLPLRVAQTAHTDIRTVGVSSFGIGGTNAHLILTRASQASSPTAITNLTSDSPRTQSAAQTSVSRPAAQPSATQIRQGTQISSTPSAHAILTEDAACGFLYEAVFDPIEVAQAHVPTLPIVLLDAELCGGSASLLASLELSSCYHVISFEDAPAAAVRHGALGLVGGAHCDEGIDKLLFLMLRLLVDVGRAATSCDLFAFFADVPRYAGCRALLRTARKELPTLAVRNLTMTRGPSPLPALHIDARVDAGKVYERRLRRLTPRALSPPSVARVGSRGAGVEVAIVTGGIRGVGLRVGEFLLDDRRARRVVLLGRSAPRASDRTRIASLVERGAEVRLCDVGEWSAVEGLPDAELVIHCAGSIDDQLMQNVTAVRCSAVLRPKIDGVRHLRRRFGGTARLVAFSSTSALFGVAGQATYAAANAYLDELLGGDAIQWGGWGEVGMAVDYSIEPKAGERFLPLATGLQLLGKLLDAAPRAGPAAVVDVDWDKYTAHTSIFAVDEAPLYSPLVVTPSTAAPAAAEPLPKSSPLIGEHTVVGAMHAFTLTLGLCEGPWQLLRQHVVGGVAIVPASAYVAWVVAALHGLRGGDLAGGDLSAIQLHDCRFLKMLDLGGRRSCTLTLSPAADGASVLGRGVAVVSYQGVVHATMEYQVGSTSFLGRAASTNTTKDNCTKAASCEAARSVPHPYTAMLADGYSYGPAFAQMAQLCVQSQRASALLVSDSSTTLSARGPVPCCPATLDAALQLASFLDAYAGTGTPIAIATLEWRVGAELARTVATEGADGAGADVEMFDASNARVGMARGLQMAPAVTSLARLAFSTLSTTRRVGDGSKSVGTVVEVAIGEASTAAGALRALRAQVVSAPALARAASDTVLELTAAAAHDAGAWATDSIGVPLVHTLTACEPALADESIASADEPYVARTDAGAGRVFFERIALVDELAPTDIEVHTSMWALNFRDVLVAKGAISSVVAGRSLGLGGECYGVVRRVGAAVRTISPGDRVVALPPDGMGSFLITDARWVFHAEPSLDAAAAVSGTMAYATAWLALHTQARVRAGDDVLIHSAAGGVGLAAVALCVAAGCRVFATASTDQKRQLLLSRGVAAVFNSRSHSDFGAGVREATGGAGVDVVLNSLTGEALTASIELLKPFGRLVELGKRDAYEGRGISLTPFLKGITISAAHIDVLMLEQPDTARRLFDEVRAKMPTLPALPYVTYPMDSVNEALRFMGAGTHVGKILIATSAVPAAPRLPWADCTHAPGDSLARSVASALGTRPLMSSSLRGRCVVLPEPPGGVDDDAALDAALRGAEVVITRSRLVGWYATQRAGVPLAIEMRSAWTSLAPSLVRQLVALRIQGHLVARPASADASDTNADWVPILVSELLTSDHIDPDAPLESYGVDSLMLITLASRMSARLGRRITSEELEKLGTMRALQDAVRAGDQSASTATASAEVRSAHGATGASAFLSRRPRILCIHGYRSSAEIMELQMHPYVSALGDEVDFVFAQAPTRSTGPPDPTIPDELPTFEWYGVVGGSYDEGWLHEPQPQVLDEGLRAIAAQTPYEGVIGFSQGGAVASMVDAHWAVFFSTITPPPGRVRKWGRPTLHVFDRAEEYVPLCEEMAAQASDASPEATEVIHHKAGHHVPQDAASVDAVVRFCRVQLDARREQV